MGQNYHVGSKSVTFYTVESSACRIISEHADKTSAEIACILHEIRSSFPGENEGDIRNYSRFISEYAREIQSILNQILPPERPNKEE